MIDFTRAFDTAWERMMVLLFRPFRLEKWFVIGFSAFLAGLLAGGNGYNGSGSNIFTNNSNLQGEQFHFGGSPVNPTHLSNPFDSMPWAGMSMTVMILIFALAIIFGLVLGLVLCWLGSRGQFLLLDNVVRNRGAIAGPWGAYASAANRVFGFYVLLTFLGIAVFVPFVVVGVIIALPLIHHQHAINSVEITAFVFLGIAYLVIVIPWAIFVFLFREWAIPLVFRHGGTVRHALGRLWTIIRLHPGATTLFVLLRMALAIGVGIISIGVCCFTCCLEAIPYLGTVFLLPVLLFIKCFSLDCLAQFGPDYDVWTVDVPPAAVLAPQPPPPAAEPGSL
jgi:hypothetical protein